MLAGTEQLNGFIERVPHSVRRRAPIHGQLSHPGECARTDAYMASSSTFAKAKTSFTKI
jgi:hypothetical protein